MRLLLVTLSLLLAGCIATPSDSNSGASKLAAEANPAIDPIWDTTDALPFVAGTYQWHDAQADPFGGAYGQASQAAVHPCLFQGEDDDRERPYFNNLRLTPEPPAQYVPNGTTHFTATLSWGPTDWNGEEMFLTYIGGAMEHYTVTGGFQSGAPNEVPLRNTMWDNGTTSNWDIWACIANGAGAAEAEPFTGALVVDIQLLRKGNETA